MTVVQINATCGVGSTGKICVGVSELLTAQGIENYILYSEKGNGYALGRSCADGNYIRAQALKSRIFGNYGFNSKAATDRMIAELEQIRPDIVHLHNIHGHDCDLEKLFTYFKAKKTRLIWTFHDCWAFTGYCPHFDRIGCDKWKTGCHHCPQAKEYSWFFDRSQTLYQRKKELFSGLDLTIVTPSQWLADLVRESFLKEYPVKVINNGIDLDIFRPCESHFRQKYHCEDKFIVLGVAFGWGIGKGLDVFIDLAGRLDDRFQIVLVGTDDKVDRQLPENIISIHRTQNQTELAEIYTAADLFVNPTREENYPTVHMESVACGTPVLTFATGGSPEMLDETCGSSVARNDIDGMEREILRIRETGPYSKSDCLNKAKSYGKEARFREYVDLYRSME